MSDLEKLRQPSLFDEDVLKQHVQSLEDLPLDQARVGGVVTSTDAGIVAQGSKSIGKTGFAAGTFEYWKQQGWRAAAFFGIGKRS